MKKSVKTKIKKAILDIKKLQDKYCQADTMIVYHSLGKALDKIGWEFACSLNIYDRRKKK